MKRILCATFVAASLTTEAAAAGQGFDLISDMQGFAWETGGFPPSIPGDQLSAVGTVGSFHDSIPFDPEKLFSTWYLRDLVSVGEVV